MWMTWLLLMVTVSHRTAVVHRTIQRLRPKVISDLLHWLRLCNYKFGELELIHFSLLFHYVLSSAAALGHPERGLRFISFAFFSFSDNDVINYEYEKQIKAFSLIIDVISHSRCRSTVSICRSDNRLEFGKWSKKREKKRSECGRKSWTETFSMREKKSF